MSTPHLTVANASQSEAVGVPAGSSHLGALLAKVRGAELTHRQGVVQALQGLAIKSDGPNCHVGELCMILPPGMRVSKDIWREFQSAGRADADLQSPSARSSSARVMLAEVVALDRGGVTLMPYGGAQRLAIGSTVVALGDQSDVGVGDSLLGRVIDALGRPLDGGRHRLPNAVFPFVDCP